MGMVKTIFAGGWDFDRPIAMLVKHGSRGLIGGDRREFLKQASHVFLPYIDAIEKAARDEEIIHLVSHGATEAYGANRNGDGFKEAACRKYAPTFEKFAHYHRNHKNKVDKGDLFYGSIKKAAYNEEMRRVELLVGLFKNKEATDKHGDQARIADKELEKLARGDDIPVSMACRVPYDSCSWCGNQARTRDDYCTASMCKAGGCKENLTRLVKVGGDIHQLHVDNEHPTWFDISGVFRPADRIAWGAKADYLVKAAADACDGLFGVCSAKMAEDLGIMAPLAVIMEQEHGLLPGELSRAVDQQVKLAYGLDMLDRQPSLKLSREFNRAFDARTQGSFDVESIGDPGTIKCAEAMSALADEKIVLPMRDFARLCKKAELAESAQAKLPGVYGRMIADGTLERRLTDNPFAAATKQASLKARKWAAGKASAFSLEKEAVDKRCKLSAIRGHDLKTGFEKSASLVGGEASEQLARDYACYKAAALQRIASNDNEFMLTARLSLSQNHVA